MKKSVGDITREEIYNRFIYALTRLKQLNLTNERQLPEITELFFGRRLTGAELVHLVITDDTLLIELTVITAILETAATWREFKSLWKIQKTGESDMMVNDNGFPYTSFDSWLVALGRMNEA